MSRALVFVLGIAALAALVGVFSMRTSSAPPATSTPRRPSPPHHVHAAATLDDVERQTGVPVEHLIRELHLPENVATDVPLRQLSVQLGFEMRDVRRIVREYLETHAAPST
jgi:hypothetical protein